MKNTLIYNIRRGKKLPCTHYVYGVKNTLMFSVTLYGAKKQAPAVTQPPFSPPPQYASMPSRLKVTCGRGELPNVDVQANGESWIVRGQSSLARVLRCLWRLGWCSRVYRAIGTQKLCAKNTVGTNDLNPNTLQACARHAACVRPTTNCSCLPPRM